MTPSAITHAGKGTTPTGKRRPPSTGSRGGPSTTARAATATAKRGTSSTGTRARASAPARAGHGRSLPKRARPSAPRRVSGPLRGAGSLLGDAVRIQLPASPRLRPRRAPKLRRAPSGPLPVRVAAFVRALPDHALIDRVVRGRTWIALLGLMLAGIVAMQVEVLKLGASEGRSLQESAALQSRNELLRASVASLSDDQRIERLASQDGMVMPPPTDLVFLPPNSAVNANRAANNIHVPDATTFLATLPTAAAGASVATDTAAGTADTTLGTTTPSADAGTPDSTTPATGAATPGAETTTTDTGGVGTATPATVTPPSADTPVAGTTQTESLATTPATDAGASTGTGDTATGTPVSPGGGAALPAGTPAG
jgi:hypothetical protein